MWLGSKIVGSNDTIGNIINTYFELLNKSYCLMILGNVPLCRLDGDLLEKYSKKNHFACILKHYIILH